MKRLMGAAFGLTLLRFLCGQSLCAAGPDAGGWRHEELRRLKAEAANQGVAVYAIDNHALGKSRKDTGARWVWLGE